MENDAIEKQMIYVDSINLFFWSEYLSVISPNAGNTDQKKLTYLNGWSQVHLDQGTDNPLCITHNTDLRIFKTLQKNIDDGLQFL